MLNFTAKNAKQPSVTQRLESKMELYSWLKINYLRKALNQ